MTLMTNKKVSTRVSESACRIIPAPPWTKTWHPVSHAQLIDSVQGAVARSGLDVVDKQYSLSANGSRMFGFWQLDAGNGSINWSLGFRHGLDKSMKIAFLGGSHVGICDNLMLSGSYIAFAMHTSGMDEDRLASLADQALSGAIVRMEKLHQWQKSLHDWYVPRQDLKQIVFDMVTKGVFSGGQITNYLGHLEEEKQIRHGRRLDGATSLYAVHGAATRLMRPWSLLRMSEAAPVLEGLCDDYIKSKAA